MVDPLTSQELNKLEQKEDCGCGCCGCGCGGALRGTAEQELVLVGQMADRQAGERTGGRCEGVLP